MTAKMQLAGNNLLVWWPCWISGQHKLATRSPVIKQLLASPRSWESSALGILRNECKRGRHAHGNIICLVPCCSWPTQRIGQLVIDELLVKQPVVVCAGSEYERFKAKDARKGRK